MSVKLIMKTKDISPGDICWIWVTEENDWFPGLIIKVTGSSLRRYCTALVDNNLIGNLPTWKIRSFDVLPKSYYKLFTDYLLDY